MASNLTSCVNASCAKSNVTTKENLYYTSISIGVFNFLYITVLIIGVIGNGFTTAVILLRRKVRRSIYLYTLNLVACDILILGFYVPTQMKQIGHQLTWDMGEPLCKVVNVAISVPITCTIATLLAITIDRARALIKPFKWRLESWKRAKIILPVIWLISILVNAPLLIFPKLHQIDSAIYCVDGWPEKLHGDLFWTTIFVINFAFPLVVIATTYLVIIFNMKQNNLRRVRRNRSNVRDMFGKRMIRMVVALLIVFFVCSGCQHIFYFIFEYSGIKMTEKTIGLLFGASNFLVSLQAALNPFLYCRLHDDLWKLCTRKELKKPLVEIARLSSYIVVRTTIFEEADIKDENCFGELSNECCEHISLKVPTYKQIKRISARKSRLTKDFEQTDNLHIRSIETYVDSKTSLTQS